MDLVELIYKATAQFPREELYGLTNQLRRAAVSVPSNIAEGQGRGAGDDFARFLRVAMGSSQESETQVLIAIELGYVHDDAVIELKSLMDRTGRLIRALRESLR